MNRLPVLILIEWGTFLSACSTGPVVSKVVYEDATRMVRVDVTYRTGKEEHRHPAIVSVQELNHALQSVTIETSSILPITFRNGGLNGKAFERKERKFLATHAVQALSRATPLEEVMFFWVHTRANEIREVTSGSLYIENDDLQLVLANLKYTTTRQVDVDRAKRDPLEVLGQPLYSLKPGPGNRIARESFWDTWFSQPRQHLVIPLKNLPSQSATAEEKIRLPSNAPQESPASLRKKLTELQELRDDGLITDEEYLNKRRELLEQF